MKGKKRIFVALQLDTDMINVNDFFFCLFLYVVALHNELTEWENNKNFDRGVNWLEWDQMLLIHNRHNVNKRTNELQVISNRWQ